MDSHDNFGRTPLPDSKTYYKARVIIIVYWYKERSICNGHLIYYKSGPSEEWVEDDLCIG